MKWFILHPVNEGLLKQAMSSGPVLPKHNMKESSLAALIPYDHQTQWAPSSFFNTSRHLRSKQRSQHDLLEDVTAHCKGGGLDNL